MKGEVEDGYEQGQRSEEAGCQLSGAGEKILCGEAGLIRPTFYHHFKDKYDLIEWIWYQDVIEPARFFWEAGMILETEKLVFAQILKEKEYYTRISKVEGQNSFKEIVIHSLEEVLLDYISESASGIPEEIGVTPSRIAGYYANSFYYILDNWIRKGMSYSAQQMADIYHYVSTHSLEDVIHQKEV